MSPALPEWLAPDPWLPLAAGAREADVSAALAADDPGPRELAALLSPVAGRRLEEMAQRALALTQRHFGRTIQLYAPLYLANFCVNGCIYCGFAADRHMPRLRLELDQAERELAALKALGFAEVLLLTGERTPQADFDYLLANVKLAARKFSLVTIEAFPMTEEEYRRLVAAGCTGMTIYQETYAAGPYDRLHRWGPKKDYFSRLETPARALAAGMRQVGLGVLLGLHDPVYDALCLFNHARRLRREYWRGGLSVSFPRLQPQAGGFHAPHPVTDRFLAQLIYAFRLCLPDVPLVLSTREPPALRDGLAGVGVNKMSIASRTTVGGYAAAAADEGQFEVGDHRDIAAFCAMLRGKGLDPVFKNWDVVYRDAV